MKQMLSAFVLLVTISACSHGSSAHKCDEGEKQQLTAARDEATRQLANAEQEFARYGVLTLQNGDGYGSSRSRRDTALADVRQRLADLIVFAEKEPACFTAAERAELTAADRAAADRAETAARESQIGGR
jgi:hypothetical protein